MTAEGRRTMGGPATLGPLSLTDKTAYQYKCSTETVAIYVQNKSRLTLYLAFQDAQPTALDASLPGIYNAVVLPGHQAVVPVQSRGVAQAERQLNSIGAFTGSVWLMPRDYSGTNAGVGVLSAFVGVFISAYGPYDPLPSAAIDQPSIDLSSQPRVISIPVSGEAVINAFFAPGAANATQTIWQPTVSLGGIRSTVYLYNGWVAPWTSTLGIAQYNLYAQPVDGSGNLLGSAIQMATILVSIYSPGAGQYNVHSWTFTPSAPLPFNPVMQPGTAGVRVFLQQWSGNLVPVMYMFNLGIATTASQPVPSVGNANALLVGASASQW